MVAGQGEHSPGILHCGQDLLLVANDTLVLKQPGDVWNTKGGNPGNMKSIESSRVELFALPMKISESDGAPARVIALEDR